MGNATLKYTRAVVDINFSGNVDCDHCPLLETYARKQCRRTGEYIYDSRGRGLWCPLILEEKGEEKWDIMQEF